MTQPQSVPRRALLSVSDKEGIVEFARELHAFRFDILSTGGTAELLRRHGIPVTEVADYTGFPEILDGRVKTLHPKIYGGLLARRGQDEAVLQEHHIAAIDLVAVNLYPFSQTVAQAGCTLAQAIEMIDIGGVTLLRAAAKNHQDVTVLVDKNDYSTVLAELKQQQTTLLSTRQRLAQKAFSYTAQYDTAISAYLAQQFTTHAPAEAESFPDTLDIRYTKKQDLRYGENPHQRAAFYQSANAPSGCIANAKQLQGKPLSFNNILDSDAALECVKQFSRTQAACVIVKHTNPCGAALADNSLAAYQRAFATDPDSAFGGIIAFNQSLDAATAKFVIQNQFVEIIIAPQIEPDALTVLAKKTNLRVLQSGTWPFTTLHRYELKQVEGGLLMQDADHLQDGEASIAHARVVSQRAPTASEWRDLEFAWRIAARTKSNAIIYAKDQATVGIGAGQMSRIDSVKIAGFKAQAAQLSLQGTVLASDAFFPFRDVVDVAAKAGVSAIIQPGGSIRDEEVIQAADEAGLALVFTGKRHFRH